MKSYWSTIHIDLYPWILKNPLIQEIHILLERKCVRENASVGSKNKEFMSHTIFNVTAYACVLSNTFSLQEDMQIDD